MRIPRAISLFLTELQDGSAVNTQREYRFLLNDLQAFADSKGYVYLEQVTRMDVRDLRSTWGAQPQAEAKNMSIIKSFFEYCLSNE
jgi:site-specific recombinase XerD